MAKRGSHAAQVHAAGTAMGVGTDIVDVTVERWNFVQVVQGFCSRCRFKVDVG